MAWISGPDLPNDGTTKPQSAGILISALLPFLGSPTGPVMVITNPMRAGPAPGVQGSPEAGGGGGGTHGYPIGG